MSRGTTSQINELAAFSQIFERAQNKPYEQQVSVIPNLQSAVFLPNDASQEDLQSARTNLQFSGIEPKVSFLKSGKGLMVYGDIHPTTPTQSKIEPITPWLS